MPDPGRRQADETFWLTDDVHADGDIVEWVRDDVDETWSPV